MGILPVYLLKKKKMLKKTQVVKSDGKLIDININLCY